MVLRKFELFSHLRLKLSEVVMIEIELAKITKIQSTLTQNENFTLFIMGFTKPEIKTPVPPNAGNEIQSCVGMLNFISWGVSL